MSIRVACPKCQKQLNVASADLTKLIKCPICNGIFRLRMPSANPSPNLGTAGKPAPSRPKPPATRGLAPKTGEKKAPPQGRPKGKPSESAVPAGPSPGRKNEKPRARGPAKSSGCTTVLSIVSVIGLFLLLTCAGVGYWGWNQIHDAVRQAQAVLANHPSSNNEPPGSPERRPEPSTDTTPPESAKGFETPEAVYAAASAAEQRKDAKEYIACHSPEAQQQLALQLAFGGLNQQSAARDPGPQGESFRKDFKPILEALDKHGLTNDVTKDFKLDLSDPAGVEQVNKAMRDLIKDPATFAADMLDAYEKANVPHPPEDQDIKTRVTEVRVEGGNAQGHVVRSLNGQDMAGKQPIRFVKLQDGWKLAPTPERSGPTTDEAPTPVPPTMIAADAWKPFTSREGGFTISFPGTPKESVAGLNGENHLTIFRRGDNRFLVSYEDLPPEVAARGAKALYADIAAQFGEGKKSQRDIELAGQPGLELVLKESYPLPGENVRRLFLVKGRAYEVDVYDYGGLTPEDRKKFLDSFRLTGDYSGAVGVRQTPASAKSVPSPVSIDCNIEGGTSSVAVSDDGRLVITHGYGQAKNIQIWEAQKQQKLQEFDCRSIGFLPVAVSPDGRTAAYCSYTIGISLREIATGKELRQLLPSGLKGLSDLRFSPKGDLLLVAGSQSIVGWDPATGAKLVDWPADKADITALSNFFDEGKKIASGSEDGTVKIREVATGKILQTLSGGKKFAVCSLAATADGQTLVSGSLSSIQVWDVALGTVRKTIEGASALPPLCLIPKGKAIVYPDNQNNLIVDYLEMDGQRHVLQGHTKRVKSLALTPDGTTLVSGSDDKTIKVWDLKSLRER
jgi:WD40 repeat protein